MRGWIETKLGDIAEIRMCKRIFAEQTLQNGEVPFYKIGTFGREPDAYISPTLFNDYKNRYPYPKKGDILLSAAGTIGRAVIFDGKPSYFQDSNIVWLDIDKKQIYNEFLYFCYQVINWASPEGSTISRLYNGIIRDTSIKLPPLPEQQKIAEALSDMDGYINALEKLIAKKEDIKKGTMQELLTGKRRLPGFSGEWMNIELGEPGIAVILKGTGLSKSKISSEGTYKCILYGELFTRYSERINKIYSRTDFDEGIPSVRGDVLIPGSTTTTGIDLARASSLLFDNVLIGGDINIIRPNSEIINSVFLAYYITNLRKNEIALRSKGITVYHLHGKDLVDLPLYIPASGLEQDAIAEILLNMDVEIDVLKTKLTKIRDIKQGMMQELLTGRIRLVDEEAEEGTILVDDKTAKVIEMPKADKHTASIKTQMGHNQQFDDAVTIAAIVNALYSNIYPLGRKKLQKCLYLLRRYQNKNIEGFKKKAAGPYADEIRYKGGEPIASQQGYIKTIKGKRGINFLPGPNMQKALGYVGRWHIQKDIQWVVDNLKYRRTDDLELLATVDMAISDLEGSGIPISLDSIKYLIGSNAEWKAKLKRQTFSDKNICRAVRELKDLLEGGTVNGKD